VLAAATVLLRLPAYLADRHLTVDDGVFGASALAMRTGALPYREVFSSQGPLFLPLVWVFDLLGLRTLDAPRLLALASGVGLVLATYAAARELTDRPRALLAAGVVAATGSVLWVTAPIAADGPALALATATVALALVYWALRVVLPAVLRILRPVFFIAFILGTVWIFFPEATCSIGFISKLPVVCVR